jgi:uncharacterized protein YndB with AHSA1/START domain
MPRPHKVIACEIDLHAGRRFNTTFEVERAEMNNKGVYLEVLDSEKLVFTDTYTDTNTEGWKPAADPFVTAILLFSDAADGGRTQTARDRTPQTRQAHKNIGFLEGWGIVANQLEDYA